MITDCWGPPLALRNPVYFLGTKFICLSCPISAQIGFGLCSAYRGYSRSPPAQFSLTAMAMDVRQFLEVIFEFLKTSSGIILLPTGFASFELPNFDGSRLTTPKPTLKVEFSLHPQARPRQYAAPNYNTFSAPRAGTPPALVPAIRGTHKKRATTTSSSLVPTTLIPVLALTIIC